MSIMLRKLCACSQFFYIRKRGRRIRTIAPNVKCVFPSSVSRTAISISTGLLFLLVFLLFLRREASATSFLNPEINLVSGVTGYNLNYNYAWFSSDSTMYLARNYVDIQRQTTMTFTETGQNSTQAQICENFTSHWEESIYDWLWQQQLCIFRDTLSGTNSLLETCRNENKDVTLYAGTVTGDIAYLDCAASGASGACNVCGLDPQWAHGNTPIIAGNSSTAVLQLNCQGANAQGVLNVKTFVTIANKNRSPRMNDVSLNGYLPATPWLSTYNDPYWFLTVQKAVAYMNWAIPINQQCGSTISLTPSATGFAEIDIYTINFVATATPCELGGITISPSEVWPARTEEGLSTTATIGINLVNPAPASGCEIRLKVEPVDGSGGHHHDGSRTAHTGAVEPNTVVFVPGESIRDVVYNAGEVAGTERIIAEVVDSNGSVTSTQSVSVDVAVPDLVPLGGFMSFQLVGSLDAHPANHYGLISTVTAIGNVADQYYIETGALLGINDMSLVWGGLFDIAGSWSPPHSSHRKGTSVDIDRHAYMNGTYVVVDRARLNKITLLHDGVPVVEATIHYEF